MYVNFVIASLFQISLLSLSALVCTVSAQDPFGFGIGKIPPYGIPPMTEVDKEEIEKIEKTLEGKEVSFEKAFPWLEKESAIDNGIAAELDLDKELELDKLFGIGFEKGIATEKSFWYPPYPWALWEKYFGTAKKKMSFQQALALELFKKYGYYGLWVAKELERRFTIAKQLGLIGEAIAFQEAINLGLFKGIGLDKIFEASLKAAGVQKAAAEAEASRESLEKVFGFLKKF